MALLSLFWGLAWPSTKIVLSEIPPWTFRTVCLMAGGIGLLALARLAGSGLRIPFEDLKPLLITALFNITFFRWHMPATLVIGWQLLLGEPVKAYESAALGLVVVSLGLTGLSRRQVE